MRILFCLLILLCSFAGGALAAPAPVKVQDYLYEVTISDYEDTQMMDALEALQLNTGVEPKKGCVSLKNGNLIGRNFDWGYDTTNEFVVHVPAREGRHASVGLSAALKFIPLGEDVGKLGYLPFYTLDGINDSGLFCSIHIPPIGDRVLQKETNPGKRRVPSEFLPRLILDKAGSVEEALQLVRDTNVYPMGQGVGAMVFIADREHSAVIDFMEDGVHIVSEPKILTNFYLSEGETEELQGGKARYHVLKENYAMSDGAEGMRRLLEMAYATNAYREETLPHWYDDFDWIIEMKNEEERDMMFQRTCEAFKHRTRTPQKPEEWTCQTMHSAIYDLEKKTMELVVQENGIRHSFGLE